MKLSERAWNEFLKEVPRKEILPVLYDRRENGSSLPSLHHYFHHLDLNNVIIQQR